MAENMCSKCFLCFFNLIVLLVGIGLIGFGAYLTAVYGDFSSGVNEKFTALPFGMVIVVGVLFFFWSILGLCATSRNSRTCFGVFLFVMFVILAMEIAAVALGVFYKDNISEFIHDDFKNDIDKYDVKKNSAIDRLVDRVQELFHCCGNDNYTDWNETSFRMKHPNSVPDSCCKNTSVTNCGLNVLELPYSAAEKVIYTQGCHDAVFNVIHNDLGYIIAVVATFAAIQILCVISTIYLLCIRSRDRLIDGYDVLGDGVVA